MVLVSTPSLASLNPQACSGMAYALAGAGSTVNFSLSGATKGRCAVAAISTSSGWPTVHLMTLLFVVVRSYSDLGILFPS